MVSESQKRANRKYSDGKPQVAFRFYAPEDVEIYAEFRRLHAEEGHIAAIKRMIREDVSRNRQTVGRSDTPNADSE